jgi:mono/diheme cytochrome c family protein
MNFKFATVAAIGLGAIAVSAVCQDARSVWDGVYTSDQAKRGKVSYQGDCMSCHGDDLAGSEAGPPLAGSDFMSTWGGRTVANLFDRIHATMPADNPGKLSNEVDADILAFILASNKFPAGSMELPPQSAALQQIHLDAENPKK